LRGEGWDEGGYSSGINERKSFHAQTLTPALSLKRAREGDTE